ncbi:hypothetical protein M432DRAFT_642230 [Thermoascus aurantiacus ATCC 26904]
MDELSRGEDDHNSDISPTPTALGGHLSPREAVDDGESELHGQADGVCPVPDGAAGLARRVAPEGEAVPWAYPSGPPAPPSAAARRNTLSAAHSYSLPPDLDLFDVRLPSSSSIVHPFTPVSRLFHPSFSSFCLALLLCVFSRPPSCSWLLRAGQLTLALASPAPLRIAGVPGHVLCPSLSGRYRTRHASRAAATAAAPDPTSFPASPEPSTSSIR